MSQQPLEEGVGAGVPALTPAGFDQHPLHRDESVWSQTNCYLDVWIELLHGLGLAPEPLLAAAVAADAQIEQFEFLKIEHRDLEEVYGIRVGEYDIWTGLLEQTLTQMRAGNLLIVEADAHWLPDTRGVSYGIQHTKTSIVVLAADPDARRLVYLHNEGLHELSGPDFDHVLGEERAEGIVPAPYVELIRLDGLRPLDDDGARAQTRRLLRVHAARAPQRNPVEALMEILRGRLDWLAEQGMDGYHALVFETTRQLGVVAMLAAAACRHAALADEGGDGEQNDGDDDLRLAARSWLRVSEEAKALQFQLARAARGRRSASLEATMGSLPEHWATAAAALARWVESSSAPDAA